MSDGIPTGATPGPRIVVTGAAGFIGKRCVAILRSTGAAPLAIAHRWAGAGGLDAALGDERIDHALHLGWYAAPHDYLHNRAGNQASLEASLQLSAALRERGCRHLTVAGTSAEYAASPRPLHEDDPVVGRTPYAESKIALHRALLPAWGDALCWTRIFNLTGPGEPEGRIVSRVVRALLRSEELALTDGGQVRDFLDVDDVAAALVHCALRGLAGTYNIGSGVPTTLRELFLLLAEETGGASRLRFGAIAAGEGDDRYRVGDVGRIRSSGWAPRFGLREIVRRRVAAAREQA